MSRRSRPKKTSAESAEVGLQALEEADYAIVLSDLNLPGMHGLEFCRAVRDRWPNSQILILTGHGDLDAARAAIRLDVVDFLKKPCSLGDLEVALDRALRRRRHHVIPHVVPDPDDETPAVDESWSTPTTSRRLGDIEREHILEILAQLDGNREAAAGIAYKLQSVDKQHDDLGKQH